MKYKAGDKFKEKEYQQYEMILFCNPDATKWNLIYLHSFKTALFVSRDYAEIEKLCDQYTKIS